MTQYQTPPDRDPLQEMANKAATGGAGLAVMGRAIGTLDHHKLLRASQDRVDDTHRLQMKLLGAEAKESKPEDDEMGDTLSVSGDTHNHYTHTQQRPGMSSAAKMAGIAALSAALGGGSVLAPALLSKLYDSQPVAPVQPRPDNQYSGDVRPGFGTPQYVDQQE